jgi:hypothetical protein
MLSLMTDMEIVASENTALRATVEGLQAERAAFIKQIEEYVTRIEALEKAPPKEPAYHAVLDETGVVQRLEEELRMARHALEESAESILKILDLEQHVFDLGAQLLRASCRLTELEDEKKRMRNAPDSGDSDPADEIV